MARGKGLSKTEAAHLIGVSVNTLDKWIGRGAIPTVTDGRYKRPRVPVPPALKLAEEVDELRHIGHDRGLIAAAIGRLEQKDPQWQREFEELYGESLRAMKRDDLVKLDLDSFGSND